MGVAGHWMADTFIPDDIKLAPERLAQQEALRKQAEENLDYTPSGGFGNRVAEDDPIRRIAFQVEMDRRMGQIMDDMEARPDYYTGEKVEELLQAHKNVLIRRGMRDPADDVR